MNKFTFIFFLLTYLTLQATAQGKVAKFKIDTLVHQFMRNDKVPGAAIAILQNGTTLYSQTYGLSNLELKTQVTNKTVFELASVTKQLTAALITTLSDEGKLSLEDKISKYIDSIPEGWKSITVRQLLGHMGGLVHKFEPMMNGSYLLNYDTRFMLEAAKKTPMLSKPGTDWEYSDQGYFLAGYIAEKATGKTFDVLMKEKIFDPMRMIDTRFLDQNEIIPNRAAGYIIKQGRFMNNRRQWQFELTPHFGVMSTINDMINYEKGLVKGLISKKVYNEITTPYRIFYKDGGHQHAYGLGWEIHDFGDRRIVTHSGYTGTVYLRDLKTGLSIIVLTNRDENQGTSQNVLARRLAKEVDQSFPKF
jgi:D-alanyl-D-alanine carboxypeptidase